MTDYQVYMTEYSKNAINLFNEYGLKILLFENIASIKIYSYI